MLDRRCRFVVENSRSPSFAPLPSSASSGITSLWNYFTTAYTSRRPDHSLFYPQHFVVAKSCERSFTDSSMPRRRTSAPGQEPGRCLSPAGETCIESIRCAHTWRLARYQTSDTRTKRYGRLLLRKRFLHYTHPLNTGNVNVQSLTKLEIESIRQAPDTYIPETLVLPQLQDLTLKGFNTRHFFMSFMTYPTMPQLIRLRLKNCSFYGVTIDMALPKNCPRLRIFEVVGGSYFQRFWASFERMVKETHWHIESFTFMPAMTLGSGRPLANNLNYWLPEAYEMHIKADCFLWETNPIEQTLNIPNKVRHLVVEATAKVNYSNVQVPWITSILNGVQWILENKRSYVLDLESITIWAWLDKNSRDRHGELVKIGEREGVQIKMFDKSEEILMTVNVNGSDDFIIAPRTSTRLSRTVHRLSPIF